MLNKKRLYNKKSAARQLQELGEEIFVKKLICKLLLLIFLYLCHLLFNLMSRSGSNPITLRGTIWGMGYEADGRVVADRRVERRFK